ncbi:PREDICTED: guanine nucleotide exchange factor MSS4-like [Priapulus caudatus]|uniref:Guanine nucleotide exchange factor MSS4-like n=1 Tax=Priapulus caudatus TaxID=37621 RepID=A0ABM1DQF5_PRICU|nr:PREDICTED: guanine nucleotide exchange factor MSS4-like [Priapulus caudatus]
MEPSNPEDHVGSSTGENSNQMPISDDVKALLTDARTNNKSVCCERCDSVVLKAGDASLSQVEFFLPHMKKKTENQRPGDGETLREFWLVGDMCTFENVGFSNTVETTKYLTCADCEVGPIGWCDVRDRTKFYVAVDRVSHK